MQLEWQHKLEGGDLGADTSEILEGESRRKRYFVFSIQLENQIRTRS